MNARNEFETATNTLASHQSVETWELQDELNDADLIGISGGLLDNLNAQNALQYALQNVAKDGIYIGGNKNA